MAVRIILKNSSVEDRRPTAGQLENGEIALNYNEAGAFLTCKDTNGDIQQVGGVKINDVAPDAPPIQCLWFQPSTLTLFVYDGDNWLPVAGGGGGGTPGGGDITQIIGNQGIDANEIAGIVTLDVELDGTNCGLKFRNSKLSAEIATDSKLGSVKIGDGIDVAIDGTISVDIPQALTFRGSVDLNNPPSGQINPEPALIGDAYVSKGIANPIDAGWTGIGGEIAVGGDLVVFDGSEWELIGTGGTMQAIEGGDGIDVVTVSGVATVAVDLADTDAGLEFDSTDTDNVKLRASIASDTQLGSVKIGDGIDVDADGIISVPAGVAEVNLGYEEDPAQGTITNDAGDDAVIPLASVGDDSDPLNIIPPVAGLFTGEEKEKLAGIEDGATNQDTNDGRYVLIAGPDSPDNQTITGTGGLKTEGLLESAGGVKVTGGSIATVPDGIYKDLDFTTISGNGVGAINISDVNNNLSFYGGTSTVTKVGLGNKEKQKSLLVTVSNFAATETGTRPDQGLVAINASTAFKAGEATTNVIGFFFSSNDNQASADVTNQYGFFVNGTANTALNNYGFYGDLGDVNLQGGNNYNFYADGTAPNFFAGDTYIGGTTTRNTRELWESLLTEEQKEELAAGTLVVPANVATPGDGSFARQWYYDQQDGETQALLDSGELEYPKHFAAATFTDTFALGDNTRINLNSDGSAQFKGDVEVGTDDTTGVVLTSPSGNKFRLVVDDAGNLLTVAV